MPLSVRVHTLIFKIIQVCLAGGGVRKSGLGLHPLCPACISHPAVQHSMLVGKSLGTASELCADHKTNVAQIERQPSFTPQWGGLVWFEGTPRFLVSVSQL